MLLTIVGQKDGWKRVPDKSHLIYSDLEHLKDSIMAYLDAVIGRLPDKDAKSARTIQRELKDELINTMDTYS